MFLQKFLLTAFFILSPIYGASFATDILSKDADIINAINDDNAQVPVDIIEPAPTTENATPCASAVFANALSVAAKNVSESDDEYIIRAWIYKNFQSGEIIKDVLECPEIKNIADDETIIFTPVEYIFSGGRKIIVNYKTQPKILKQRLLVANKQALPEMNPNPRIGAPGDINVWTNTDPAWYGIIAVQSGTLDAFIGTDKNNTIGVKYIKQNIKTLFPKNSMCTSGSALANDNEILNLAAHKTLGDDDSGNDYYISDDVDLGWITWAEVAFDVALTVGTAGVGTGALWVTKSIRATRAAKNLVVVMKDLEKIDKVQEFIKVSNTAKKTAEELKTLSRLGDTAKIAEKTKELGTLTASAKELEKVEDVAKYIKSADSFGDVMKFRRAANAWKIPQRGNVIARSWRSLRAINTGNKTIGRAAKVGKASSKSGAARDWLFQSTLKNAGMLAKFQAGTGIIYGGIQFLANVYDWSEISTGEFTNNVEFWPLLLLSGDNMNGQTNVVNHGMWFMWAGDSMNPADDDAAYLQAMDFAAKFHQDVLEINEDKNGLCDIDIFVVRPILKNPGGADSEIYYLIMNDAPWTVK